ncbi:MAG: hypothetical protein DMF63_14465 [Acidobacteria bacterium]|nr:MAG: hypothetical protein DMF63_14465 [Acidobacteriota bacterium]
MQSEKIETELAKIQSLLVSGDTSERQYEQLYAAQQALAWALDERVAKAPVAMILQGGVSAPVQSDYIPISTDIPAETVSC